MPDDTITIPCDLCGGTHTVSREELRRAPGGMLRICPEAPPDEREGKRDDDAE